MLWLAVQESRAVNVVSPQGISLQGTLLNAQGLPEEAPSITFTVQVLSPGAESCTLYQESQVLNMTNSGGVFSFVLGNGTRSGSGFQATSTLSQIFNNASGPLTSLSCANGTSYTPSSADSRKVSLIFDDGSGAQTLTPSLSVEAVPFAMYADSLQGMSPSSFIQVNSTTAAVTQANVAAVFSSNTAVSSLLALINGTSTQYLGSTSSSGAALPTFTSTTLPSAPVEGDVWYNTTTHSIEYQSNSGVQNMSPAATLAEITAGPGISVTPSSGSVTIAATGIAYPASDTTSGGSIAIGSGSLAYEGALSATAFSNTAVGYQTIGGSGLTTAAIENTAVGFQSLYANTSGYENTALGMWSLFSNTSGYNNVGLGNGALFFNQTGSGSTAIGTGALTKSTNGLNTAVGGIALYGATTGYGNVALGFAAGYDVTTGGQNILIGSYATTGVGVTSGSNNILMGYDVRPPSQTASNQLNIGNLIYATGLSSGATPSSGSVGIGDNNPSYTLHVSNTSTSGAVAGFTNSAGTCTMTPASSGSGIACSSDERLKQNITEVDGEFALNHILKLQAVTYEFKKAPETGRHTGFIAQKVQESAPEFVRKNDDGFYQIYYDGLVPWITEAVKQLHHKIVSLSGRMDGQERDIASIKTTEKTDIDNLKSSVENLIVENTALKARLQVLEAKAAHQ